MYVVYILALAVVHRRTSTNAIWPLGSEEGSFRIRFCHSVSKELIFYLEAVGRSRRKYI